MLGQIERNVLVKGAKDIFLDVELVDEAVEDLALDVFGRRDTRAVGHVGTLAFGSVGAGIEARCRESEQGGEGGKCCEED